MNKQVEKIRKAIERRHKQYADEINKYEHPFMVADLAAKEEETKEILSIIDSLQEEPVSEDLEEEIKKMQRRYKTIEEYDGHYAPLYASDIEYIARYFVEWSKNHIVDNNEMVSEELEEEHNGWIRVYENELDEFANEYSKTIPLPEKKYAKYSDVDMVIAIKAGAKWMKQQMMQSAVTTHFDVSLPESVWRKLRDKGVKDGDQLIIIKG